MKIYSSIFNKISNSRIKKLLSKSAVQYLLLVLFLLLGTLGIFILSLRPDKVDVNLGQRAPQNIHAPKTIEDVRTTENLRNEASNAVEAQFRIDSDVRNEVQRDIENTFEILYSVKEDEDLTEEEKTKAMQDENPVTLGENIITGALSDSRESIEHLESYLYEIAAEQLNGGIRLEDLPTVKASAEESIRSLDDFSEPLKLFGIRLFSQSIRPNEFYDAQRTEELKQQAMEDVDSVIIGQYEFIVREG